MSIGSEIKAAKAKAIGGKKDRCRKGKSCSATCISGWKACLVEMPDMVSSSIGKLKNRIQTGISKIEKVLPGKSREQFLDKKKEDYLRVRGKLVAGVKRAYLKGDDASAVRLQSKLYNIQNKVGSKLNIPKIKGDEFGSEASRSARREKYNSVKKELKKRLKDAALTGDLNRYNKLEKALLDLTRKAGKKFGDKEVWRPSRQDREDIRKQKYNKAQEKIINRLKKAAEKGDKKEYSKLEESLGKMHYRTGWKTGAPKPELGKIWEENKNWSKNFSKLMISTQDYSPYLTKENSRMGNLMSGDDKKGLSKLLSKLSPEEIAKGYEGIKLFTSSTSGAIRRAQTGRKLSSPEETKQMKRVGDDMDKLIKQLPKVESVKFRGVTVDDKMLQHLIDASKTKGGYFENASSSWSTKLAKAEEFSKRGLGAWGNNLVIFRSFNKRGALVDKISSTGGEMEVLTPRDAKYIHNGYSTVIYQGRTYHLFDLIEQ